MTTVRTLVTRPLTTVDLAALESLHGAAKCDPPIGMEKFSDGDDVKFRGLAQSVLQTEGCQTFGAFYEEELVGAGVARYVAAQQDGEKSTVHIEVLYVRPEFRRRGIGQLLLKEIADWAALMRATHVACLPLPAARRARRLLAMMGLLPVGSHHVIPPYSQH